MIITLTDPQGNELHYPSSMLFRGDEQNLRLVQGYCDHGISMFDLSHSCYRVEVLTDGNVARLNHVRPLGPDVLGDCDCCGEPVPMDGHLLKQPFNAGYYCIACDTMENAHLRKDPCLGGRP